MRHETKSGRSVDGKNSWPPVIAPDAQNKSPCTFPVQVPNLSRRLSHRATAGTEVDSDCHYRRYRTTTSPTTSRAPAGCVHRGRTVRLRRGDQWIAPVYLVPIPYISLLPFHHSVRYLRLQDVMHADNASWISCMGTDVTERLPSRGALLDSAFV